MDQVVEAAAEQDDGVAGFDAGVLAWPFAAAGAGALHLEHEQGGGGGGFDLGDGLAGPGALRFGDDGFEFQAEGADLVLDAAGTGEAFGGGEEQQLGDAFGADMGGQHDAIGAGLHQLALRGRRLAAGDDEQIAVEAAGAEGDEDVGGVVGQHGDHGAGALDAGLQQVGFLGGVTKVAEIAAAGGFGAASLAGFDDDEGHAGAVEGTGELAADAAEAADQDVVLELVDATGHAAVAQDVGELGGGYELHQGAGHEDHAGAAEDDDADGDGAKLGRGDRTDFVEADGEDGEDDHVERVAPVPAADGVGDGAEPDHRPDEDGAGDQIADWRGERSIQRLLRSYRLRSVPFSAAVAHGTLGQAASRGNQESDMARMTGGEAIVDGLLRHGIDTVFGLPGVQVYGLFDALARNANRIRLVNARHEQSTAYMALGYACASGRPGAYAVVPGPGVLNTTAALATAWGLNAPVLCLTGQVPSMMIGRGRGQLHELPDQLATLRSLLKYAERIEHTSQAPYLMARAFQEMRSGRPGPVALEMPWDQFGAAAEVMGHDPLPLVPLPVPDPERIAAVARMIDAAKAPMIWVGGGALHAGAEVKALAEKIGAPVVCSAAGGGCWMTGILWG